jgi:thiamine transporter ThiT
MTSSPTPSHGSTGTSSSGIPLVGVARLDAMSAALARNWWLVALRGVIAILFGVLAFVAPGAFVLSLVLFFAAYMLADGVFAIVGAVRAAQRHERWGFLLLRVSSTSLWGSLLSSCRRRPSGRSSCCSLPGPW